MGDFDVRMDDPDAVHEIDSEIDFEELDAGDRVLAFLHKCGKSALIPNLQSIQTEAGTDAGQALTNIMQLLDSGYIRFEEKTVQLATITPEGRRSLREQYE